MSGIRVSFYEREELITERDLHAHFANPNNGGGKISSIHYPLFSRKLCCDAVIIFHDEHTAEVARSYEHEIKGEKLYITELPKHQVFRKLKAEIDPGVAAFLQITESARDEIVHHGNLEYEYDDENNTAFMTGTWYQLEWAWKYIDSAMYQQQKALDSSANRKQRLDMERLKSQIQSDYSPTSIQANTSKHFDMDKEASADDDGSIQLPKGTTRIHVPGGDTEIIGEKDKTEGDRSVLFENSIGTTRGKQHKTGGATEKINAVTVKTHRSLSEPGGVFQQRETKGAVLPSMSVEDKDAKDLQGIYFIHEGIKIRLFTGDIALASTEAIVNTGRSNLDGVSYVITSAADPMVVTELKDYFKKYGELETGDVICTRAGGQLHRNVRHILHTVGPLWTQDLPENIGTYQLTTTFLNCLRQANRLKLASVTFPAISTGTYMGSIEICAKCFLDAILLYAYEYKDEQFLREVHMINNYADVTANMVLSLRQYMERGLDLLTIEATEEMGKMQKNVKKNPGLLARMKAGINDFLCSSKKGTAMLGMQSWKSSSQNFKPPTSSRTLPKPPVQAKGKSKR